MKIVKWGTVPTQTKEFTCRHCETVFEADYGEYTSCNQLEFMHDGLEYKAECPVCHTMCYIDRGDF